MPLGLLSLAANLQKNCNEVKIYKPTVRLINKADYKLAANDILKNKPGLIGFSTWCITYPASLLIAKEIKNLAPEISIIFGGPQASILSKETLSNFSFIDFVLSGEADVSFPQFINELQKPVPDLFKIAGLSYRNGTEKIKQNKLNGVIANLTGCWKRLPVSMYLLFNQ